MQTPREILADLWTLAGGDPAALDRAMRQIPGVVETGLFIARASLVIVAGSNGIRKLQR